MFLTYKAVNDSDVFKFEVYVDKFKKLIGQNQIRHIEKKEVIMEEVIIDVAVDKLNNVINVATDFVSLYPKRQSYKDYWLRGYDHNKLNKISTVLEETVLYLSNSDKQLVINKLMDYPILKSLFFYYPVRNKYLAYTIMALFPIGLIGYIIGIKQQKLLRKDINTIIAVSREIIKLEQDKKD